MFTPRQNKFLLWFVVIAIIVIIGSTLVIKKNLSEDEVSETATSTEESFLEQGSSVTNDTTGQATVNTIIETVVKKVFVEDTAKVNELTIKLEKELDNSNAVSNLESRISVLETERTRYCSTPQGVFDEVSSINFHSLREFRTLR